MEDEVWWALIGEEEVAMPPPVVDERWREEV